MCDGCGRGRNEFAGRVQNHYVRFSFHRNIIILFLEYIVKAAAGLDTLRCRLRERCHCGRLPSHYRRARTQDYLACWTRTRHDFSLTCHSVQRARQPLSRRDWRGELHGGRGLRAPAHLSRKSWERTARKLTTLYVILWLINLPSDRK